MPVHSIDRSARMTALDRISLRAKASPETVFNNLGYLITEKHLADMFQEQEATKALGIDKVDKHRYGGNLSSNLSRLLQSIRKGTYKPQAMRIVEIPKEDGSFRPLAISCFEDKLVQGAVNKILTTIYEPKFLPCSYGFRPNQNCHDALKALTRASYAFKDGAMVEIDIRKCFNMIPHGPLMHFLRQKISDSRFLNLVERLITAPVMKTDTCEPTLRGCPQGSIISPVLANIYLHHVIDEWFETVKRSHFAGKAELIRYADDMVFVFQNRSDAKRFFDVLGKRLNKYGLNLHEDKSGLMESGSNCAKCMDAAGKRMPTFNFLGFTCYWGKARDGSFWRLKYTSRGDRFTGSLKEMRQYLRKNLNTPDVIGTLAGVVRRVKGWTNYHAISDNDRRVTSYIRQVQKMVHKWFNRKSQRKAIGWEELPEWLKRVNFPQSFKTISMFT